MNIINFANFGLDLIIVLLSLWVLRILIGYGGLLGRALNLIGVGTVIIGGAQLIETVSSTLLNFDVPTVELVHRLLLVLGFVFIFIGYRNMMKKQQTS